MRTLKNLSKITVLYANFDEHLKRSDPASRDMQLEEGKAFASSHGWNLEKIFVDTCSSTCISDYCRIKDRAFCITHKKSPLQKLLMPELVPIPAEPAEVAQRGAFYDMLAYIKKNPVNVLLTVALEQLFKNLNDLHVFIKHELEPRGIELHSITENFSSHSSEGKQLLRILDVFEGSYYVKDRRRLWH
ncbi:MAG: recombinase family protein [bacterium]